VAGLQQRIDAADALLRGGDVSAAQTHYRAALVDGWMLVGAFEEAAGHAERARDAFHRAAAFAPQTRPRTPLAVPATGRGPLENQARSLVAGAQFNLGVIAAQQKRFDEAVEAFDSVIAADSAFPRAFAALGIACFNAGRFDRAKAALARAVQTDPADASLRRLLALSDVQLEDWPEAVSLLAADPDRDTDPALQFAYGVALVASGRADEAASIFGRLLASNRESAELNVVLGLAQAQQGEFDAAVDSLRHALRIRPDVPRAHAALGTIELKRGQLADAERDLRAELDVQPADANARHVLATVLDLEGRSGDALVELRRVLAERPGFADAQYLAGKILLAEGSTREAVERLEAAVRLAPDHANAHYQLAQAYRKAGRADAAQQEFDLYRALKEKRRGDPR
jgi:tetratricopeptide (TPR) repeat protein